MQPSQLLFDILESFEKCELVAYQDDAGIWTIGWGTVYYPDGSTVKEGDTCTLEQANSYLTSHLQGLISHLNATTPATILQPEFDALLDLCYRAGQGAWDGSSLKKQVNSNSEDYATITDDFMMWVKEHRDGVLVTSPGLVRRAKCESYLYRNGVNAPNFFNN